MRVILMINYDKFYTIFLYKYLYRYKNLVSYVFCRYGKV